MNQLELTAIIVYIIWNVVVFTLYGIDKNKAKQNKWRIKERTLIATAFFMGAFGALMGMNAFRHKTKHMKFKLLIPLAAICNIGGIGVAVYFIYFSG